MTMPSYNMTPALNSAIPGFSGLSGDASSLIKQLMSGNLTYGERRAIYDAGAERGTASGMPGSTGRGGSLFANADARNIGLQSGQRQQQGFQDLLAMLSGYSGAVVPTVGQQMQSDQFGQNLAFQQQEANRNYGLKRNQQDLQLAEYNQRYGPKEYSQTSIWPGGGRSQDYKYYMDSGGRTSPSAASLMYKYRY